MAEFQTNACGTICLCLLNLLAIRCLQLWSQPIGPLCLWQCFIIWLSPRYLETRFFPPLWNDFAVMSQILHFAAPFTRKRSWVVERQEQRQLWKCQLQASHQGEEENSCSRSNVIYIADILHICKIVLQRRICLSSTPLSTPPLEFGNVRPLNIPIVKFHP